MNTPYFCHLHTHSQSSILDASASITDLVQKAKTYEMPALALTDHGNLYSAIDFYKECKAKGIIPIIGCEMYIAPHNRHDKKKQDGVIAHHITLLAKDFEGYKNLCKLSSKGFTEGFYYVPRIDLELLKEYATGLICLSGCIESPFAHEIVSRKSEKLYSLIDEYLAIFGDDFYIEIQKHTTTADELELEGIMEEPGLYQQYHEYIQKQEKINQALLEISEKKGIVAVATNNVHYIEREDWKAHEILLNVQSGEPCEIWQKDSFGQEQFRIPNPKRSTFPTHENYFKSQQEMLQAFQNYPHLLENSRLIVEKCKLTFNFSEKHYPVYTPKHLKGKTITNEERIKETEKFLWQLCEKGVEKRYTSEMLSIISKKYPEQDPLSIVRTRLEYEMSIIISKGMCDYLLIVWDFIHWAKSQGIPMGPGRGSGAGSIILYLIEVTDIEPLQFHLFFERFINPERVSYPDIDVDMCMQRRHEVINYTIEEYGKDNVAQIITFGSMKAKMAVKDVGRVLNIPLAKVNAIAKLIPEDLNITIEKALVESIELKSMYETDSETKRIIDIARKLEGSTRSTGMHAAGLIISGENLTENIPVCTSKDSDMLVTQYSMKPVEMVGMLKIDFLGLTTLTCIQICVDAIFKETGKQIDWVNLSLNDKATFDLLNQGKTQGLFQLESGGMQELARELHLDKFEEIIAVVALYRPGPMNMIPSFINRKHNREPIEYDHPWLEEILAETYGIMVYQEQVMQIASRLANYTLAEGDVLRRAMGKKDMKEMAKQREKFLLGAKNNDISEEIATKIFDKMEKFAEYGFNKSHAAAYGYVSYVTAFLKANYPGQWLAALMTCAIGDVEKVARFVKEARQSDLEVLSPDINESISTFFSKKNKIRFALSAIKGVGEAVVEAIIDEREKNGPFKHILDFLERIDTRKIGKKTIELLIEAGCFDYMQWHRDLIREYVETHFDRIVQKHKETQKGVMSLFDNMQSKESELIKPKKPQEHLRSKELLLFREKELLGFFLTGHPLDSYRATLDRLGILFLETIETLPIDTVFRAAFVVEEIRIRISAQKQRKFAIITISDGGFARFEIPIWSDLFDTIEPYLQENTLFLAVLAKEKRNEEVQISCKWLKALHTINQTTLEECDQAYDKAKEQITRTKAFAQKKAQNPNGLQVKRPQEKNIVPVQKQKRVILNFNISSLRASHILHTQKLLKKLAGDQQVFIIFNEKDTEIASLRLAMPIIDDIDTLNQTFSPITSFISAHIIEVEDKK